ncbi:hypothetical protein [Corynebacterium ureicelerivorans]|uniref:Uncharacterized protein n=1 Tax=Corynebacterium ureicelerivorans TaxID=401472 RepID=A0A077HJH0_9CORY|nr:hypothetical protein [Corynebacterium ureicelerivorans]AIL96410.1 hypothetical protein CUREI_03055 [Corynebacterium ureicelerivorans]AIL97814.1 hypothetical protein CUREI_11585 [Corynebacterium ureicelerivorans]
MSIDYDRLRELVGEMEQGVAATTRYIWIDLARELLRLRDGVKQVADDLGEKAEYAPNVPRREAYLEAEQRLTDLLNGDTNEH